MKLDPYTLYISNAAAADSDSAHIACGAHCTSEEQLTGRDADGDPMSDSELFEDDDDDIKPLRCRVCGKTSVELDILRAVAVMATKEYAVRFVGQKYATICEPEQSGLRWSGMPGHSIGERVEHGGRVITRSTEEV